jgi:hypothetical protein
MTYIKDVEIRCCVNFYVARRRVPTRLILIKRFSGLLKKGAL